MNRMEAGTPSALGARNKMGLTRYQWLTLGSAFVGWMFDSMDLNLFTLVLYPSVSQLAHTTNAGEVARIGSWILAAKLLTWGLGGIIFGVAADRFGRARVMSLTIFIYAGFTLLSAFAQSWQQLAILQALAGFGIGGEWSAGAALVAETWPEKHRARAMQIMQMAFAFGFFAAALDNLLLGPFGWRWVLGMGVVPAIATVVIRRFVREPERWVNVRESIDAQRATTTFLAIFQPGQRRKTIVGVVIASAPMIGYFSGLTYLPSWIHQLVVAAGGSNATRPISYAFMLMMFGAVLGYLTLIWLVDLLGRRLSYFLFWVGALVVSLVLFMLIDRLDYVLWFMPVYGYFVIGGFGTFAAYLPELFPTRMRATGQGFCWNMARALTCIGPLTANALVGSFGGSFPMTSAVISLFFVVGLVAIWFGPETKGIPLGD